MNSDGASQRSLGEGQWGVRWGRDGTELAHMIEGDIHLLDLESGEKTKLPESSEIYIRDLTWSPDGTRIAVVGGITNTDIYMMDPETGDLVRLTDDGHDDAQPAWSPDGSRIAYFNGSEYDIPRTLWTVTTDGVERRQVSDRPAANAVPQWSPDSQTIGFSWRAGALLVDAEGGNQRSLNYEADNEQKGIFHYEWMPDGESVVCSCGGGISELDIGTGRIRPILPEADSWDLAPAGDRIAVSYRSDIYRADLQGNLTRLTDTPTADEYEPKWSPDGSKMLFWVERYWSSSDDGRPLPECRDGYDNDEDGSVDREDPACRAGDDGEDRIHVEHRISFHYAKRASTFRGRLERQYGGFDPSQCLRNRAITLQQWIEGRWQRVVTTATKDDGSWELRGPRRPSGLFSVGLRRKTVTIFGGDELNCWRGGSRLLPVFVNAPVLHPYCGSYPATLAGTQGSDALMGSDADDRIVTFGGDDVIRAGGGSDLICAGPGDDLLFGGPGRDGLIGGHGNDELRGDDDGTEKVEGWDPPYPYDWLAPGPGDDLVYGGGVDTISFSGSSVPVTVDLATQTAVGEGTDTIVDVGRVIGTSFDDLLMGNDLGQILSGGYGNDRLEGAGGDDDLEGDDGDDALDGGRGEDDLDGGNGNDALDGGEGADFGDGSFGQDSCINVEMRFSC